MDAAVDAQMAQAVTDDIMSRIAVQQNSQNSPAKGAMAFRSASLYWCPRKWGVAAAPLARFAKSRGRKHA
jgi:hypothetical protein